MREITTLNFVDDENEPKWRLSSIYRNWGGVQKTQTERRGPVRLISEGQRGTLWLMWTLKWMILCAIAQGVFIPPPYPLSLRFPRPINKAENLLQIDEDIVWKVISLLHKIRGLGECCEVIRKKDIWAENCLSIIIKVAKNQFQYIVILLVFFSHPTYLFKHDAHFEASLFKNCSQFIEFLGEKKIWGSLKMLVIHWHKYFSIFKSHWMYLSKRLNSLVNHVCYYEGTTWWEWLPSKGLTPKQ